ncbi:hypothetical protein QBC40DRAFT_347308 [Triangularia verruculosa]|uniref:Integral membrane protein n=1 Tax=Triangularia verruculosa TaxID=2587418 RepID=A0AAN6XM64_9PEZI|nr:hypothetical protein QBC40DRAFT_347308 [Triangularia verruculosa]
MPSTIDPVAGSPSQPEYYTLADIEHAESESSSSSSPVIRLLQLPVPQRGEIPVVTLKRRRAFPRPSKDPSNRIRPLLEARLRNNMLPALGFVELANAGDVAANVYNSTPIPITIILCMVAGGTACFSLLFFLIYDALRSWKNICGLRRERKFLHNLQQPEARRQDLEKWSADPRIARVFSRSSDNSSVSSVEKEHDEKKTSTDDLDVAAVNWDRTLKCFLHINTQDLRSEIVYRFGMDIIIGVGILMVSAGTWLATRGEDPYLFDVSNLLTGFLGNSPLAFYAVINMAWALYLDQNQRTKTRIVESSLFSDFPPGWCYIGDRLGELFSIRANYLHIHVLLNGLPGLIAGAMSLATATQWWAYVVLIPCIVNSVMANRLWRHQIGYDRPFLTNTDLKPLNRDELVESLLLVDSRRRNLAATRWAAITMPFCPLLQYIVEFNLFEQFCLRLLSNNPEMTRRYFGDDFENDFGEGTTTVTVDAHQVLQLAELQPRTRDAITQAARDTIWFDAKRGLESRERWLIEILEVFLVLEAVEKAERRDKQVVRSDFGKKSGLENVDSLSDEEEINEKTEMLRKY